MIWLPIAVLTLAVGLLFAMMAELAARVDVATRAIAAAPTITPMNAATAIDLTASAAARIVWPGASPPEASRTTFDVLVLTTVCSSCHQLAEQLGANSGAVDVRLMISTADPAVGSGFVAQHALEEMTTWIDNGGRWCQENFGISLAPILIRVRDNAFDSAFTVYDISQLATLIDQPEPVVRLHRTRSAAETASQ